MISVGFEEPKSIQNKMKKCLLLMAAAVVINGCSPKKMEWVAIGDSITY